MHSGGYLKEAPYSNIIIEAASENEAIDKFKEHFRHDPNAVACECCGNNYAISTSETLEELTEYHRRGYNSRDGIKSLDNYLKEDFVYLLEKPKSSIEEPKIDFVLKRNIKL